MSESGPKRKREKKTFPGKKQLSLSALWLLLPSLRFPQALTLVPRHSHFLSHSHWPASLQPNSSIPTPPSFLLLPPPPSLLFFHSFIRVHSSLLPPPPFLTLCFLFSLNSPLSTLHLALYITHSSPTFHSPSTSFPLVSPPLLSYPYSYTATMAKRKTTTRKTRQSTSAAADSHPYRSSNNPTTTSTKATRYSKYASSSPSIASSPSPQPSLDQAQQRRRKGNPVRSPAQGDVSKGIVFAFRIQNDPDLSMAVDILSYDPALTESPAAESAPASTSKVTAVTAVSEASSQTISTSSSRRSSTHSDSFYRASSRELWSNDPSSYLTNNVVDLSRNVLILHSRKPVGSADVLSSSAISSRPSSQPSSPPFLDSSSSSSSSPASSPGSPPLFPTLAENGANKDDDLFTLDSLSSPSVVSIAKQQQQEMSSLPPRMLRVRGLGTQGRTMQVYLV